MKRWIVLAFSIVSIVALVIWVSFITGRVFWLFSLMYFIGTYYTLIALFGAFWSHHGPRDDGSFRPFVTVMIPAKNEEQVIANTLKDLMAQDYSYRGKSRMDVIVIDDDSTDNTYWTVRGVRSTKGHRIMCYRNRGPIHGKPAALNFGLEHARGEIICVFDADARIPPDFISKAVPYFMDEKVSGVQGKVRIFNRYDSTLTEVQDDEFASFNRAVQRSRDAIGGAVALGGNGQLTRKSSLLEVGGWKLGSITEDLELSVRFYEKGWKIRYAEGSTVYQEGVVGIPALFKQRTRWCQGHIITFLEMAPAVIWSKKLTPFKKFDLMIYLMGIMTPGFVFFSYFLGFLAFFSISITSGVSDLLWIWASIAFIPVVFWGLYGEVSKNPIVLVFKSLRIFIFCFHWIPVFFYGWYKAILAGVSDKHPHWEKTRHSGAQVMYELWRP